MISRTMTGALAVAATISAASAEASRAAPIEARVDASGHVTASAPSGAGPQRIGSENASIPCAAARALPPDEARALVQGIAARENFYPDFVLSVAKNESGFNSVARSQKGAFGLMQLMPETAARFQVDLCDPAGNVLGGVRFLRALHEKYRNPFFILAAYNAGEAVVEKLHGVPPYPETVRFVAAVINDFYAWPTPGRAPRETPQGAVSAAAGSPGLAEPPAFAKPTATAAPTFTGKSGWDDGFVMHFD